jgi:vacuolar-type H+-ATPase subunit I/STV1
MELQAAAACMEGTVKRISLFAGVLFLAFSLLVVATSWSLEYYSSLGPGPGFFPFWLGALLALLSLIWLVQIRAGWDDIKEEARFLPEKDGLIRVASIIGSLVLMIAFMDILGFQLSMFLFLLFLLIVLGRVSPWLTVLVAAIGGFGLNYLFTTWLDVQLPASGIPAFAAIGL